MSTIDLLGSQADYFLRESLDVYVNASGVSQYVGKTSPEKTLTPIQNKMSFMDGMPRVKFIEDFSEIGYEFDFTFMQGGDPNILALALTGNLDKTSTAKSFVFLGSDPGAIPTYEWRFVMTTRGGELWECVFRKATVTVNGGIAIGGTEYAGVPVKVTSLKDDTITDATKDMVYFGIVPRPLS